MNCTPKYSFITLCAALSITGCMASDEPSRAELADPSTIVTTTTTEVRDDGEITTKVGPSWSTTPGWEELTSEGEMAPGRFYFNSAVPDGELVWPPDWRNIRSTDQQAAAYGRNACGTSGEYVRAWLKEYVGKFAPAEASHAQDIAHPGDAGYVRDELDNQWTINFRSPDNLPSVLNDEDQGVLIVVLQGDDDENLRHIPLGINTDQYNGFEVSLNNFENEWNNERTLAGDSPLGKMYVRGMYSCIRPDGRG